MSAPLVVYHADCPDGFCAAFYMHRHIPQAEFLPRHYDRSCDAEVLTRAEGRVVYYVDFSTTEHLLRKLCAVAERVYVLDHHKTAREALLGIVDPPANLYIAFDMARSGARMAYDYLYNPGTMLLGEMRVGPADWCNVPVRHGQPGGTKLVDYVQDRDLWLWQLPHSREINAFISSFPSEFDAWLCTERALGDDFDRCRNEGAAILRFAERRVAAVLRNVYTTRIAGPNSSFYDVPCVNTASFISEVGEALNIAFPEAPFAATWFVKEGKQIWSLRTQKTFDVGEIAKANGGGGHPRAAGFTKPTDILV